MQRDLSMSASFKLTVPVQHTSVKKDQEKTTEGVNALINA